MVKKIFQTGEKKENEKDHLLEKINEWQDNIKKARLRIKMIRKLQKLNAEEFLSKKRKKFYFKCHASEVGEIQGTFDENKEANIQAGIEKAKSLFPQQYISRVINIGEIIGIKINIGQELKEKLWEVNPATVIQQIPKPDNIILN